MNLNLNLERDLLTLSIPGDLISTNAEAVRAEISAVLNAPENASPKWTTLRLDLAAAKMVDSVGLNLIVTIFKRLQQRQANMQIAYRSQNVLRTFAFTRLDQHVELVKV